MFLCEFLGLLDVSRAASSWPPGILMFAVTPAHRAQARIKTAVQRVSRSWHPLRAEDRHRHSKTCQGVGRDVLSKSELSCLSYWRRQREGRQREEQRQGPLAAAAGFLEELDFCTASVRHAALAISEDRMLRQSDQEEVNI